MNANSHANKTNPGWKLSRQCIHDVYMAKRNGVFDQGGLMAQACASNLRHLRETQLSAHFETKMIANRYLVKRIIKHRGALECSCCWEAFDPSRTIQRADEFPILVFYRYDMFLCESCLEKVLMEMHDAPRDAIVVYIEGGIVHWLAMPEINPTSYVVADSDVSDGGDADECRDFCIHLLMAYQPGMRFI